MNATNTELPFSGFLPHSVKLYPIVQLMPEQNFLNTSQWPSSNMISQNGAEIEGQEFDNQIYIHVPFCPFICHFCPLYKVKEKRLSTDEMKEYYLDYLIKEIRMYGRSKLFKSKKFNTIYLGGGTPTELTAAQISRILIALRENFDVTKDAEVTLEGVARQMHNTDYLVECFRNGINRISFGVQSLSPFLRKAIGRGDAVNDYLLLINKVREIDPSIVINIEIMAGLPTQTFEMFCQDVDEIVTWNINSLDILYYVMLPDTKLYNKIVNSKIEQPRYGKQMMDFRRYANRKLQESGFTMQTGEVFVRNERDMFTKTGFGSKNNSVLALGPSSFGYINNTIYQNVCDLEKYISSIEQKLFPVFKRKILSHKAIDKRMLLFTVLKLEHISDELIKKNNVRKLISEWDKKGLVDRVGNGYNFTEKGRLWYNHMQIDLLSLIEKLRLLEFFGTKETILKMYERESKIRQGPITELLSLVRGSNVYGYIRYQSLLLLLYVSSRLNLKSKSILSYSGKLKILNTK